MQGSLKNNMMWRAVGDFLGHFCTAKLHWSPKETSTWGSGGRIFFRSWEPGSSDWVGVLFHPINPEWAEKVQRKAVEANDVPLRGGSQSEWGEEQNGTENCWSCENVLWIYSNQIEALRVYDAQGTFCGRKLQYETFTKLVQNEHTPEWFQHVQYEEGQC